jgi:hypothetical protein
MEKWQPLNRVQALAARDFSRAGQTFVDYKGQLNEVVYSVLTPLGYQTHVSAQALPHIEEHRIASKHIHNIAYILNNPDLVAPNHEEPETHIFYKSLYGKLLLAAPVHMISDFRFLASMYETPSINGLKQGLLSAHEFLYLRGGFKWKKWR